MSLITTIDELQKYISIEVNTDMRTLQPFISDAEQQFIIPLLGKAFYEEFSAAYAASLAPTPVALSANNQKLLPYIQRPLAYYMKLLALPEVSVTFGELGVRVHRNEDSDQASRWQIEKLLFNSLRNGDIHADALLEFLEQNATVSVYATWFADSVANTRMSGSIVYSTAIASQHIQIAASRRVFLQLRQKIREIETRLIPKLIGSGQYEELVTQIRTGGTGIPTTANKNLIARLEPIIAKRALFMQLPFMRVQINENGVFVYSGTDDLIKPNQLASESDIKSLRQQLSDPDFGFPADERELRQFILDNIDDYPLIKATSIYLVQPNPGPTFVPRNCSTNKHFIA